MVDNSSKAVSLLEKVKSNDFKLKLIVVMDEINDDAKKLATETEVVVMRFTEVEAAGEKDLKEFVVGWQTFWCLFSHLTAYIISR